MSFGERHYRPHVGHLAKEVDDQNRLGSARQSCFYFRRVDIASDRVDVDEGWLDAELGDAARGGEKREGGCYHLVLRPEAGGLQRHPQRFAPGGDAHSVGSAAVARDSLLAGPHLRAEHVLFGFADFADGVVDVGLD
jgi:hypothetical protein